MHVVFRADASLDIGTGHVERCLTLADALREHGARSTFLCRSLPVNLQRKISARQHLAITIPHHEAPGHPKYRLDWETDASMTRHHLRVAPDWLIVDHYALDRRWELAMRPHCRRLMVIDDLANRPHECDLLLDQNLGRTPEDYDALVPVQSIRRAGPRYALLRPEFARRRAASLLRRTRSQSKNLLISLGGADKDNITGQVLESLNNSKADADLKVTVVMGSQSPWLESVRYQAAEQKQRIRVLANVQDMAALMEEADLAVGAAGGSAWERCCLGLPSLLLVLADNQRAGSFELDKIGAGIAIKDPGEVAAIAMELMTSRGLPTLKTMSEVASTVTDGMGTARIVETLSKHHD
jgi:UDP-2,4-diacetamido-2,4,6-trideoxy-beta-L-altropyranose hydrolase